MQTHYYRCQRCKRVFSRRDEYMQCTSCNHENSTDALIKVKRDEPVERGWFKGEKYL